MRESGFRLAHMKNHITLATKYDGYYVADPRTLNILTINWVDSAVGEDEDEDAEFEVAAAELAAAIEATATAAAATTTTTTAAAPATTTAATTTPTTTAAAPATTTTAAELEAAVQQAADEAAATAVLAAVAAVEAAAAAAPPKTEREAALAEASAELAAAFDAVQETTAATSSSSTAAAASAASAASAAVARVAASPAPRPSPVIERLEASMARATSSRTAVTAATAPSSTTAEQEELADIEGRLLNRLEKNDNPSYLAKLQRRDDELNASSRSVDMGTTFEYVVYQNMQPGDAEDLMIQNGADQVGFYKRKVRGERVLHLYGLLGMAGILASEIINVTSYTMIEAGFHREMAVLMAHPTTLEYEGDVWQARIKDDPDEAIYQMKRLLETAGFVFATNNGPTYMGVSVGGRLVFNHVPLPVYMLETDLQNGRAREEYDERQ
ncbi:uncharacterized protein EV154DRAFT_606530 [Mucor mucedo]|uniref:uncharacterized protein n=1 Tax=Mucor mucedo TaxID=29922 RepID=UPI00222093D9|nr:uncharacterized protein EV154DRAFT_606530 [Mucor mucedo]KAI7877552.1 hypothetical protein EV154DRAFT_606530 [Mucor mucedo]